MQIDLNRFIVKCHCGRKHQIDVKEIYIEKNAINHLSEFVRPYKAPVFICDANTKKATMEKLHSFYETYDTIVLEGRDIHANNTYVDKLLPQIPGRADLLIAVGSGTIHDLTRYAAFSLKLSFVSIPTAASVDGFVSTVAAMTWHGMKKTIPAVAPICVLADTDIFGKAPYRLTASGISDLMGKYTALLDWKISHMVTGEYFCQKVYDLEMEALCEVAAVLDQMKGGDVQCMEKLMYALILSGLAMQMVGNSRPASGAEHHVSHLWEMEIINDYVDALHGEKVSVGLVLCLEYYHKLVGVIESGNLKIVDRRELEEELLMQTFGKKGLYQNVLDENNPNPLKDILPGRLQELLPSIAKEIRKLPSGVEVKQKLQEAGCITSVEELGLPKELKELTLQLCPYARNRLTLLRLSKMFQAV